MTYDDFANEVARHFPREWGLTNLEHHDLLAAWYVFSQLTSEDISSTRASLTRPPDAGVDAVLIADEDRAVHLVQSKFRTRANHGESRKDIEYLTKWKDLLPGEELAFATALRKGRASPLTRELLGKARAAVIDRDYGLTFHFVTTGRADEGLIRDQESLVGLTDAAGRYAFSFVDRDRLLTLFDDYLVGVRPIPEVSLPVAQRYVTDEEVHGIEMSLYLVTGDAIGDMVSEYGPRLFARNVRGFQGENQVNKQILDSIRDDVRASRFRYMNNGMTVVCDRARTFEEGGQRSVVLWNPQVVNGQQTSYMLREAGTAASQVSVLMKVVRVRREDYVDEEYDDVVKDIVQATNWQTKVSLADLRSNDQVQVELARALKRLDHFYQRKSEPWGQTLAAANGLPALTRNQIADAVGGSLYESLPFREVKDRLYEGDTYDRIFDPREASYILCCHYLWKAIRRQLEGSGVRRERNRSKWLVLFDLHSRLSGVFRAASAGFVASGAAHAGIPAIRDPLQQSVKATADAAVSFWKANAGEGDFEEDPHNFFRTENLHPEFQRYLRTDKCAAIRKRQRRAVDSLVKAIRAYP